MPSARQYRYYFGVLLEEIMDKMGVLPHDRKYVRLLLHWMFRTYFRIDSTTDMIPKVMEIYMNHIRIVCNVEFGWFLHEPNEGNMENMEMKEFLHKKMN